MGHHPAMSYLVDYGFRLTPQPPPIRQKPFCNRFSRDSNIRTYSLGNEVLNLSGGNRSNMDRYFRICSLLNGATAAWPKPFVYRDGKCISHNLASALPPLQ